MEIAGKITRINNRAKKMEKKPVILREEVRSDNERDVEYRLKESFSKSMK